MAIDSEHNLAHSHSSPSVHKSDKCRKCYTWKNDCEAAVIDVERCRMCAMPFEIWMLICAKALSMELGEQDESVCVTCTAGVWVSTSLWECWWWGLKQFKQEGLENIEQSKISLSSDSACRCQPCFPFLPAVSSNMRKDQNIKSPTSETGQRSGVIHQIFTNSSTDPLIGFWIHGSLKNVLKSMLINICLYLPENTKTTGFLQVNTFVSGSMGYVFELLSICEIMLNPVYSHRVDGSN